MEFKLFAISLFFTYLMTSCGVTLNIVLEDKICDCPDAKVVNLVTEEVYYIYFGRIRSVNEFNEFWIEDNCEIPARVLY